MTLEFKIIDFSVDDPETIKLINLRSKILREPLGLKFSLDELQKETNQIHIAGYHNRQLCSCTILVPISTRTFKMRQVCVDDKFKGRGIGKKMIEFAEDYSKSVKVELIELDARSSVLEFYKKLDYLVVGDEYIQVGIPHFKMKKELVNKALVII